MKKVALFILIFTAISCGGYQTINTNFSPTKETLSFNSDNEELFILTNLWLKKKYKGVQPSIRKIDKNTGIVECKFQIGQLGYSGTTSYSTGYDIPNQNINVALSLNINDGNVNLVATPEPFTIVKSKYYNTVGLDSEEKVINEIQSLILDYKNFINNNNLVTSNSNPQKKIVEVEGNKNELFIRANKWMVENFNNAESVIQFSDKEGGIVTGKYLLGKIPSFNSYNENSKENLFALINIDLKDNAAKITIVPEKFQYVNNSTYQKNGFTIEKMESQLKGIINSFEEYLTNYDSDF